MEGSKEEPSLSVVVRERTSGNELKLRLKKIHLNMRKIVLQLVTRTGWSERLWSQQFRCKDAILSNLI